MRVPRVTGVFFFWNETVLLVYSVSPDCPALCGRAIHINQTSPLKFPVQEILESNETRGYSRPPPCSRCCTLKEGVKLSYPDLGRTPGESGFMACEPEGHGSPFPVCTKSIGSLPFKKRFLLFLLSQKSQCLGARAQRYPHSDRLFLALPWASFGSG